MITDVALIYTTGICPCSNFPLIHLILPPKIYPAPFFIILAPKENPFQDGEILPKAYLERYYGIIIRRRSYIYYRNMPVFKLIKYANI